MKVSIYRDEEEPADKDLRYQSKTETITAPTLFFFIDAMAPIVQYSLSDWGDVEDRRTIYKGQKHRNALRWVVTGL